MSWSDAPIVERLGEFWSWRKLILVPICFTLFERDADKRLLMVVIVAVCSIYMVATWLGYLILSNFIESPSITSKIIQHKACCLEHLHFSACYSRCKILNGKARVCLSY